MDLGTILTGVADFFTGGSASAVSAIGGGIIGGVASILRLKHDYKMKKLELEHKTKEMANDLQVQKLEIAGAENMQKLKMDEVVTTKDYEGLITSIKSDMATYSKHFASKMSKGWVNFVGALLGVVDAVRGLIRPIITIWGIYFLYCKGWGWIGEDVITDMFKDKEFAKTFAISLLNACIFISTTAASWWFGSRPSKPPREKT